MLATFDLIALAVSVGKIVFLTFLVILPLVSIAVYFERRISAVIQDRVGPNRVGVPLTLFGFKKDWQPFGIGGLAQAAADGLKFILKEDFVPAHVRTFYYWLAPCMTIVPALHLRHRLPRRLWHRARRLGFQFEVPLPWRRTRQRADDLV